MDELNTAFEEAMGSLFQKEKAKGGIEELPGSLIVAIEISEKSERFKEALGSTSSMNL